MTTNEDIILAINPASVADIEEARQTYGVTLPIAPLRPEVGSVLTLLGHKDREGSDALRAGQLGSTVVGTTLTDGRIAFRARHWSQAFINAIGTDPLMDDVELLTPSELAALTPEPEEGI